MAVFPRSLIEFQRRFPTDEACGEYLVAVRWPRGFRCPACGHDRGWRLERRLPTFECAGCDRQTSVTAGTVMHRSHLPLHHWPRFLGVLYLMATHANGISALQLQGQLGIGSYKTAWLLARKLRRAMVDPERLPWRGWSRSTRPACRSGRRTIRRAVATAARARAGCRSSRRWRSRAASPGGSGSQPSPTIRPGACTPSSPRAVDPGRHDQDRRLAGLSGRPGGRSRSKNRGRHGSPPRPALDPPRLQQPQALGPRHLSRPAAPAPPGLSRRVRLPLQSTPRPPRRLPPPPRPRHHSCRTPATRC